MSKWPSMQAKCSGVRPSFSLDYYENLLTNQQIVVKPYLVLTTFLCSSSTFAVLKCPFLQARCSGIKPSRDLYNLHSSSVPYHTSIILYSYFTVFSLAEIIEGRTSVSIILFWVGLESTSKTINSTPLSNKTTITVRIGGLIP